ncbi:MAG: ribosomal-protein-alanine N-acetyltransferase [Deltaproteobacteria bacterium]|nr:ribosomal-protein-alanine N-acetyltransferase [Deltaproteobacteria bacterium]
MRIRQMDVRDIPQVMVIEEATFSDPWLPEAFLAEIEGPVSHAVVLEGAEGIVGYATFRTVVDEGHLMNIAVAPERRGERWGRRLLSFVIEVCRSHGALYLYLEVRPSNVAARAMYEQAGFAEQGTRRRYYRDGEDALLMVLFLENEEA